MNESYMLAKIFVDICKGLYQYSCVFNKQFDQQQHVSWTVRQLEDVSKLLPHSMFDKNFGDWQLVANEGLTIFIRPYLPTEVTNTYQINIFEDQYTIEVLKQ